MKNQSKTTLGIILVVMIICSTIIPLSTSHRIQHDGVKQSFIEQEMITLKVINDILRIQTPLCSKPLFAVAGDHVTISFITESVDDLIIRIQTAYENVIDEYYLPIVSLDEQQGVWKAIVELSGDIPKELYNLTLFVETNGRIYSLTQPRCIQIVEQMTDTFSFVHITDFHVGDPRGFAENIKETIGYKSILRCIDEINLIHPDFVVISGDLVFGQLYPLEYKREYEQCYQMIQRFDVPTFLAPGNHDGYRRIGEDGLQLWNDYFGAHYYSFDYGSYHFQAINSYDWPPYLRWSILFLALTWGGSIGEQQLQWIEDDLNQSSATHQCMFMHHNPLWDTKSDSLLGMGYQRRDNLLEIIRSNQIDMVLAGHVHYDNVTRDNQTLYLTTTTPESEIRVEDGYWGYRLIEIENGDITRYNYKEPKYSIPSYHLYATVVNPQTRVIENALEQTLPILVKFTVPNHEYSVNYGTIIQERSNQYQKQVYVQTQVPEESEQTITLTPIS